MENRHFDYVVIGGGSAGYAAARTARAKFGKVAIIDDAEELGGWSWSGRVSKPDAPARSW